MTMKNIFLTIALVMAVGFLVWLVFEKSHSADLARNLARTKQQLTQSESDGDSLRRKLSGAESERDGFKKERDAFQTERNSLKNEVDRLKSQSDTASRRYDDLQKRAAEDQKTWQSKESDLNKELEELRRNLAASEARAGDLMAAAKAANTADQLEAARRKTEETALAQAESRVKELEMELAALKAGQEEAISSGAGECQAKVSELTESLKKAEERIQTLEQELSLLSTLKDENAGLKKSEEAARLETEHLKREARLASASIIEINDKMKKLAERSAQELSSARQEIESLKEALKQTEAGLPEKTSGLSRKQLTAPSPLAGLKSDNVKLVKDLRAQIDSKDMVISHLRDELSLTFQDRLFFSTGSAIISADGSMMLDKLASALRGVAGKTIMVVGHTDDVPIGKKYREIFPSNWELSSARALAVTRYLQESGGLSPEHLAAVGRASYRPLVPNNSAENRQKNRRVEIVISNRSHS